MKTKRCNFCGSDRYEEKCIDYLYSHGGKYLLVPDTPVEFCRECGMVYYDAAILKEIERHFLAIQNQSEVPDNYIRMPTKALAQCSAQK